MTIRAAAYARYSSDEQRQESITAQLRAIQYYADARGYELVSVYKDEAKSGRSDKRPDFLRMIEDSASGKFDAILVHKYDRFSRSMEDAMYYERALRLNNVRVVSVIEQLDNSPEGLLMKSIIFGMNQFYSANLAREVMKGLKENAYEARHTGGLPPLGYDLTPDLHYTINEREAEAVRIIFSMYLEDHSYGEIIARLSRDGYLTKRGMEFGKNSLYEILRNPKYTGLYTYNKTASASASGKYNRHKYKDESEIIRVDGGIPQIIDQETFDAVQKRMNANKNKNARKKAKVMYLLSGLLVCAECGHAMAGDTQRARGREYSYYICANHKRTHACAPHRVKKEIVEYAVLDTINQCLFSEENVDSICTRLYESRDDSVSRENVAGLKKKIADIHRRIDNLYRAVESGVNIDETMKRIGELKHEEERLKIAVLEHEEAPKYAEKTVSEIKTAFTSLANVRRLSEENQKAVIGKLIDRIYLYEDDEGFSVRIIINPRQASVSDFLDRIGGEEHLPFISQNRITITHGFLVLFSKLPNS